jgi:beta-lactamase regulating signal transducer with metallopeptidase domain
MERLILESGIRVILIAVCTSAFLGVLRVSAARVRHAIWANVVACMLLLPFWTVWGPKAIVRVPRTNVTRLPIPVRTSAKPVLRGPPHLLAPKAQEASAWTWANLLAVAYLLGSISLLGRLAIGTMRANRVLRLAVNRNGRLTSDFCAAPVTVGWLNPAVILPAGWAEWSSTRLSAVLAHENEHVRRRDPLCSGWPC